MAVPASVAAVDVTGAASGSSSTAGEQPTVDGAPRPSFQEDSGLIRMTSLPQSEGVDDALYTKLQYVINKLAKAAVGDAALIQQFEDKCALWEDMAAPRPGEVKAKALPCHWETLLLTMEKMLLP